MIQIKGRLANTVQDPRCYEVEVVPAPMTRTGPADCGCGDQKPQLSRNEVLPRVAVDAERSFAITVDDDQLRQWFEGNPPRFTFRVYLEGRLSSTAGGAEWTADKRRRLLLLDLCASDPPPPCGRVCGKVTDCRGKPLANYRVQVYDVDLLDIPAGNGNAAQVVARIAGLQNLQNTDAARSKFGTLLGTTVTNACGQYCIGYRYADYAALELGTADIRVIVGTPGQGARFKPLQTSDIYFNAGSKLEVDLTIPGSIIDASTEFGDYDDDLTRLGAIPATRATLSDEQLRFIAAEAHIPFERLVELRLAYQIVAAYPGAPPAKAVTPEVIYGLLRKGAAGPFPSWARRYHGSAWDNAHLGDRLADLITQAIAGCIVSRGLGLGAAPADVEKVGFAAWRVAFYYALRTPLRPDRSSWLELFQLIWSIPPRTSDFNRFGLAWLKCGVGPDLWTELGTFLSSAAVDAVKTLIDFSEIAGFWAPAVKLLLSKQATIGAAVADEAAWDAFFTTPGPPDIDFASYSLDVFQMARARFGKQGVAAWVASATPGTFPTTVPPMTPSQAQAAADRLSRLTTSASVAAQLAAAGFTSARDIAALQWEDFLDRLPSSLNGVDALFTYTKAREVRATSVAALLQLTPVLNAPIDGALHSSPPLYMKAPDLSGPGLGAIKGSFFGSGSACDCEGRQSVFSPAAYLHALRRFLIGVSGLGGSSDGRTQFDARQPTIRDLRFGYKNTYTIMPTIDLNNEVMEDLAVSVLGLVVAAVPDRQTTREAEELETDPEYEDQYPELYDGTSSLADPSRIWPWRFPFDLDHARRRILLDAVGLSRTEIKMLVQPTPQPQDLGDATLDLTADQRALLLSAHPSANEYGSATLAQLTSVPTMMDRSQLGFQELYALTRLSGVYSQAGIPSPAINPPIPAVAPSAALWVPPAAACDPAQYTLNDAAGSVNDLLEEQADLIHRFARLLMSLPWPVQVLDWAVGAFPLEGSETALPLNWLGEAELIRKRLKLKPYEVVGLWRDISTARWEMPFVQTKAIPSPFEQILGVKLADVSKPTSNLTLAAAARVCGVSEALAVVLAPGTWADTTAIAGASNMFRYGRLAKALHGVRPEDLWAYESLHKHKVFKSPVDTWAALQDFEIIRRAGTGLSAGIRFYCAPDSTTAIPPTHSTLGLDRLQLLVRIEELNRRCRIDGDAVAAFDAVLSRFLPPATVSVVVAQIAKYEDASVPTADKAKLDASLAELLALTSPLDPPLSATPGSSADLRDTGRKQAVLAAEAAQTWNQGIGAIIAQATGFDADLARAIADQTNAVNLLSLTANLGALLGGGAAWSNWAGSSLPPDLQPAFLDSGLIVVPTDEVGVSLSFSASVIVTASGVYEVRVTPSCGAGKSVQVDYLVGGVPTSVVAFSGDTVTIPIDIPSVQSATERIEFAIKPGALCTIQVDLVDPSGNATPLAGGRCYSDSAARARVDAALESLDLLALCADLVKDWKLAPTDLRSLLALQQANIGWSVSFPPKGAIPRPLTQDDPNGFDAWLAYARIVAALKLTRGKGRQTLYDAIMMAGAAGMVPAASLDPSVTAALALALEVGEDSVKSAVGALSVTNATVAAASDLFLTLLDLGVALDKYGVDAGTFASWGEEPIALATVQSLEGAVRSLMNQERSGKGKLRDAIDRIRVIKRDALVEFLLANPQGNRPWSTAKDLSDYLLTDVEMEPCATSSRIRFAIAAAQRLITQTVAQSEQLQLTSDQADEWQSISQYRLWEVRERILLYPESWVRFGTHLNKSPEFDELARTLLQGDLTDEIAGEALTCYAEQLHLIGHLEIVGTCVQQEYDPTGAISVDQFHVIGRTAAEPRSYYHRARVDQSYWTAWKKIEVDIDCDQILPRVHNRQLHLFWLVEDTKGQEKPGIAKNDRQLSFDDKYKTLRLAWSVLTSKGWRAKMINKTPLPTRCGHFARNIVTFMGFATPYAEVHAWTQADQDTGTYQLKPTMSPEGDVQIEVYAQLVSSVLSIVDPTLADWVTQIEQDLANAGWTSGMVQNWHNSFTDAANGIIDADISDFTTGADADLHFAIPPIPAFTPTGRRDSMSADRYLIGRFTLRPDNLVEVARRSAAAAPGDGVLSSADQAATITLIDDAVPESGALRFDDGTIELYAGGEFRTILYTAGTPARVVVTRQEQIPSQTDPIFCRIKNRSFFALKLPEPLPAAILHLDGRLKARSSALMYAGYAGRRGYTAIPREHLAIATGIAPEISVQTPPGFQTGSSLKAALMASSGTVRAPIDYAMPLAARFVAPALNYRQLGGVASWRFALAHHPQTIELLRAIAVGMTRLYTRETEADPRAATSSLTIPFDFRPDYTPDPSWVDVSHLPVDALEFKVDQASSVANWEILYHSAMSVSQQLMRAGDYDGARRWITYVFNPRDPAARDAGGSVHPENYWVFKPFHDFVLGTAADDFANLDPNGTQDRYLATVFRGLIRQWRANPYNPHAVAAFRPQAYQLATIFLYVENMIAWGDSLFAIPSAEMVEEAARHFEEAERVIGRQPRSTGAIRYDESALRAREVDDDFALGDASIENGFSLGDGPSPNIEEAFLPDLALWYFCLPPNPKIRELREKVQDRLFKVHHCLDLLGNPRQLPLYDPPIDPALLADAAMAGLNVSQAVMDAYTPRPHYRFRTLLGIAKGLVQQVSALGSGLLAAMEKQDAESLSLLKATHESKILERATTVRSLQVEDALAGIKALEGTVATVDARREYYSSREFMNVEETSQIVLSIASTIFRTVGQTLNVAASAASAVPDFTLGGAGFGGSPVAVTKTGGENIRRVPAGLGQAMEFIGEFMSTLAGVAGSMGSYRRRKDDWDFQAKSATLELKQLNAQILGAQIRQTIAERELANHEAQLDQSRDELDFVRSKQTAVNLYEWLAADIGASYYRAFQLAHSMSLQAQRALQDELGSTQRFIGYSQWDGTRKGLQAGERLMQDLVEMESQYFAQNARPGVKVITVSLALVDPIALAELKMNGTCSFVLSEAFWDRYAPELYFKRFSSVAMSVPAVAGPHSGLHGRVSIERARYRKEPTLIGDPTDDPADRYARQENDTRFVEQFPRPGDYVLLSTGVRDTGLSSDESREDRYRPFENLGVDSEWTVEISRRDNMTDISTVADFTMLCEITGRDGGASLREAARAAVAKQSPSQGLQLSMRQQYAGEWQTLKAGSGATLQLAPQLLAELSIGREFVTLSVAILLRVKAAPATVTVDLEAPADVVAAGIASPVSFALDVAPDPSDDGGTRYGFAQQDLVVEGGSIQLAYESLWSDGWKLSVSIGDPASFEDLVVAVNFVLKEGP